MNVATLEQIGRLGDAIALTRVDIADAVFWIRQYGKYLETASMTGEYRAHIGRSIAQRKRDYLRLLREVHEMEMRYEKMNGEYVRS